MIFFRRAEREKKHKHTEMGDNLLLNSHEDAKKIKHTALPCNWIYRFEAVHSAQRVKN